MATSQRFEVILSLKDKDAVVRGLQALGTEGQSAIKKIEQAASPANRGLQAIDATSRGLQGQMQGLSSRAGVAGDALTALGKGGLAAAAGLGAATMAFGAIVRRAQEVTSHFADISDQSERVGASAERLQVLRQIFIGNASSAEELGTALETLSAHVSEAVQGEQKYIDLLAKYDIAIDGAAVSSGDMTRVLEELAAGNITTADAVELLGRSAKGLQPALAAVGDVQEKVNAGLKDGSVLTNEIVQKYGDLNDKLNLINEQGMVRHAEGLATIQAAYVSLKGLIIEVTSAILSTTQQQVNSFLSLGASIGQALGLMEKAKIEQRGATGSWEAPQAPGDATARLRGMGVQLLPEKQPAALPSPMARPAGGGGGGGGGGGRVSRRGGGGGGGRGGEREKLDFEIAEPFEEELARLEELSASGFTQTQQNAIATMNKIVEANMQAHGKIVELIEKRRDEELASLSAIGLSEEDLAKAKVMINEDADRQIAEHQAEMREQTIADRMDQMAFRKQEPLVESDWDRTRLSLLEFGEELTSVEGMTQGVISSISSLGNTAIASFADAVVAGEGFEDMLESLATTIEKMIIQMTLQMALQAAIGGGAIGIAGLMGPSGSTGPAAGTSGGAPYAKGGIVQSRLPYGVYTTPTYFPMASPIVTPMARGMGLMAEDGPEAVVPLRRGPGGELGVESSPTKVQVVVNNNAGADVQTSQRRGDDGSIQIILDLVRKDIAGQMVRPGTMLNKSLAAAANPISKRS
jgi:hypothetical protein